MGARLQWPSEGVSRIPYWVYTDPEVYAREQERIFAGHSWSYVALDCELPKPGDFKRTFIGDKPIIVVRDESGEVHVLENRCAHRGVQLCQEHLGNRPEFMCPYHQWTYNLKGELIGVPLRRGIRKQGGMPEDFDPKDHGLSKLRVAIRNGVVFATFSKEVEAFEDFVGEKMLPLFDRVFNGRKLKVLGYQRQLIPSNWKLMVENIKDPYHASLLHVFLVSFGLFRIDQPSKVAMDDSGRHGALINWRGEQKLTAENAEMKSLDVSLKLQGTTMLQPEREFEQYTVVMLTLWPNLIVQQQSNTLAMRQLITKGPGAFELAWTYFGYEDDSEEMTQRRLRQANLMGPSGYVSIDDSEMMASSQQGIAPYPNQQGVLEMGGRDWGDEPHTVTESVIRAFWDGYRKTMDL